MAILAVLSYHSPSIHSASRSSCRSKSGDLIMGKSAILYLAYQIRHRKKHEKLEWFFVIDKRNLPSFPLYRRWIHDPYKRQDHKFHQKPLGPSLKEIRCPVSIHAGDNQKDAGERRGFPCQRIWGFLCERKKASFTISLEQSFPKIKGLNRISCQQFGIIMGIWRRTTAQDS